MWKDLSDFDYDDDDDIFDEYVDDEEEEDDDEEEEGDISTIAFDSNNEGITLSCIERLSHAMGAGYVAATYSHTSECRAPPVHSIERDTLIGEINQLLVRNGC